MNITFPGAILAAFAVGFTSVDMDAVARGWHGHHKKHHHKLVQQKHKRTRHRAHHRRHLVDVRPNVVVRVHIASQHLTVAVNGGQYGDWRISSGGQGFETPEGTFSVQRMARDYYSKQYDNSPMPNSVFFTGGVAIHGTYHIKQLGQAVSHGCVRLLPEHAAQLYSLVSHYGMRHTRVIVTES